MGDRELIVRELADGKRVIVICVSCEKNVGEKTEFKTSDSRRFWKGELDQMDWDIKFRIDELTKLLYCDNFLAEN